VPVVGGFCRVIRTPGISIIVAVKNASRPEKINGSGRNWRMIEATEQISATVSEPGGRKTKGTARNIGAAYTRSMWLHNRQKQKERDKRRCHPPSPTQVPTNTLDTNLAKKDALMVKIVPV